MGKSSRLKYRPPPKGQWRSVVKSPAFWIATAIVFLLVIFIRHEFAINDEMFREEAATAALERQSPDTVWDSSWPPLPELGQSAARSFDEVRALYAFAARRPDALRYVPCYCGCEGDGHRSNEDCYLRGRTARGEPQWDGHAYT